MEALVVLFALGVVLLFLPLGLASAIRQPDEAYREVGRTRAGTILGIVVAGGFGGLYYWLRIRPALRSFAQRQPPRPPRERFGERWRE
jgi:hypothetical protein